MGNCTHRLDICPDCGGLQVAEWTELNSVTGVEFNFADGTGKFSDKTRAFWTPGPTPCQPESGDGARPT